MAKQQDTVEDKLAKQPERDVIEFDIQDLSLRDIIEAERAIKKYTGEDIPFAEMFKDGKPSGAALAAFVYAIRHRDDPKFSFEDALDVRLDQLASAEPDPTEAAS